MLQYPVVLYLYWSHISGSELTYQHHHMLHLGQIQTFIDRNTSACSVKSDRLHTHRSAFLPLPSGRMLWDVNTKLTEEPEKFALLSVHMGGYKLDNTGTTGNAQRSSQISLWRPEGLRAYCCLFLSWSSSIGAVTYSSFQINNSDSPFPEHV